MILCLFLLGGLVAVNGAEESCSSPTVLMDFKLKAQIDGLVRLLVQNKKDHIHIPQQLNFTRNTTLKQTNIYNLTELTPMGDCYEWIEPGNRVMSNFTIGLHNMTLKVGRLVYEKNTTENAVIQLKEVKIYVEQETRFNKTSCSQNYKNIRVLNVSGAMFTNRNMNLVENFNNEIIPDLNKRMKQHLFMSLAKTYFDNCSTNSSLNLLNLIKSPYITSAALVPTISSWALIALPFFWLSLYF